MANEFDKNKVLEAAKLIKNYCKSFGTIYECSSGECIFADVDAQECKLCGDMFDGMASGITPNAWEVD